MASDDHATIDIAHLAKLANLPLTDEEQEVLLAACSEVLEAFALTDGEGDIEGDRAMASFDDAAEPWPSEGVAAILAAAPRLEGRHLHP